ncbi:MAG: metallophosphoesterase, partial [Gammaproteobacteria bacterium]|nr:metallophosphoesterase [Gammaproteobacteria bacterium]
MSDNKQKTMTGWYNPFKIIKTGIQVAISEVLGTRSDYRQIESLAVEQEIFDKSNQPNNEIWIDYIADTGDGWNSTYSVAYLLAKKSLKFPGLYEDELQRGKILIMGGDEVYPSASREEYKDRLIGPFDTAMERSTAKDLELFAIPGNHDWYDGLVSFTRLFCQGRVWGGRNTEQTRSYFALKLPNNWWLFAVDIQLESDIDKPQLDYFKRIINKDVQEKDRIIICTPEPDWIFSNIYDKSLENNLAHLEEIINKKATIPVTLSGDLHHYRRHVDKQGFHKITAGGGGAFLHPTNGPDVDEIELGSKDK